MAGAAMMMLGGQPPASESARAMVALKTVLKDPKSTDLEIGIKLRDWRVIHEKAKKALAEARDDLRAILTLRQEGVLVGMGILD